MQVPFPTVWVVVVVEEDPDFPLPFPLSNPSFWELALPTPLDPLLVWVDS